MPRYLYQASYTPDGVKGLIKDGGSSRRAATADLFKSLDGRLEAFYFAFGETDVYVIADLPNAAAAAAAALTVAASGAVNIKTTVLITPEEMDEVTRQRPNFTPPGR